MFSVFGFGAFAQNPNIASSSGDLIIQGAEDDKTLIAEVVGVPPLPGQVFAIRSQTAQPEIIGFAEVKSLQSLPGARSTVRVRLLHLSRTSLVQSGDSLWKVDLRSDEARYPGNTELLIRDQWRGISSRYRPLYVQGFSIGETAQVLGEDEFLIGIYGNLSYGLTSKTSVGTFIPGLFLDSPNANLKREIYRDETVTVSTGLSVTKIRDSSSTALNLTIFWDSITSSRMITHTLATFAVATLENAEDTVAIKTAGTSSLQTGYELILENWDRILFGPSYNFESKTIGGYLAYKRVWDRFHLSGSLSTVDVRELKYSPKTGYVALVEAYWRY